MSQPTVRPAVLPDLETIKAIAVAADMFTDEEVGFFDDMFAGSLDGSMEGHRWNVMEAATGEVVAASQYAPEPFADRLWNLYFIAVRPDHQGHGLGSKLMSHAERALGELGESKARVLIVETSSTDQYARTRDFYRKLGYDEESTIREYYGPGDDKVTFWKALT